VSAWAGLALALAGLVVLVRPGLAAPSPVGSLLMTLAGIAWGAYSIIGRSAVDPTAATAGNFMRAFPLVALAAAPFATQIALTPTGALLAVTSGAITSGLGYVLWYSVLPSLNAIRAAALQLSVPLIAAGGGVLLLGEELTQRFVLGACLILGGIGLTLRPARRPG
jgi:drug/metabolite transporter (DMT)-like permease